MAERIKLSEVRTACGDGVTWADVDAKRGPMAVVTPETVLALVATVEAANRHFESIRDTRAEAMCQQGPLVDLGNRLLDDFDFGEPS